MVFYRTIPKCKDGQGDITRRAGIAQGG